MANRTYEGVQPSTTFVTYFGHHVNLTDPQPDTIDIRDIEHASKFTCRFNGHCRKFFSVAEHAVNCAAYARNRGYSKSIQLFALLHDAAEVYTSDPPTMLKDLICIRELESRLMDVIHRKFVGRRPTQTEIDMVKWIDLLMLKAEAKLLMPANMVFWKDMTGVPDIELPCVVEGFGEMFAILTEIAK